MVRECAGTMRSMSLARAWRRQLLGASTAALIVPSAMLAALVVLALSGAFSQVGVLGQLFVGPVAARRRSRVWCGCRFRVGAGRERVRSGVVAAGDSGFGFGFSGARWRRASGAGAAPGADGEPRHGRRRWRDRGDGGHGDRGRRRVGRLRWIRWLRRRTRWRTAGGILSRDWLELASTGACASAPADAGGHGGHGRDVGDPAGTGAGRAGGDADGSGRRVGGRQPDPADGAA